MAKDRVRVDLVTKNVGIFRDELNAEIKFNMAGIKECINQPSIPIQTRFCC